MNYRLLLTIMLFLSACQSRTWTEEDRRDFLGGCIKGAMKDMPRDEARSYCDCMLQKIQQRYPDPTTTRMIRQDTAMYSIGKACRAAR